MECSTEKRKVGGILTFHRNGNPGAVAQAFCLSKFLGVPIIDFTYPDRLIAIRRDSQQHGERVCLSWSERALTLSERLDTEDLAVEYINSLDYVIVGSDEVWTYTHKNRQRQLCPFPNLYFGHRISRKKIAYAVSIGNKSYLTKVEAAYMDDFAHLSVRDMFPFEAIRRVSREIAKRTLLIPDPTFAISFYKPMKVRSESVMWLEPSPQNPRSLLDFPLSPIDWFRAVSGLKHAKTRRMHGLIACILGKTPVSVTCDRPKVSELYRAFFKRGVIDDAEVTKKLYEYRRLHQDFRKSIGVLID